MKYIVSLGIEKFEFEDGATAMSFAELASGHFMPTEYTKSLKPYITVDNEEEEEEC